MTVETKRLFVSNQSTQRQTVMTLSAQRQHLFTADVSRISGENSQVLRQHSNLPKKQGKIFELSLGQDVSYQIYQISHHFVKNRMGRFTVAK